ncbi:MAG: sigma-70 family RNA polymerase sigma factor [Flavobacteriaceae bacterium]|nr:sigma-70 family RNA polymerase sigma factor [Flavobacteriaceae bacterium]
MEREKALKEIYQTNRMKVCSYILANSGSAEEAKDAYQEAVIAFYENVRDGKFKGESAIGTYLYSITKFKWLNQLKKDKIRTGHHEKVKQDEIDEGPMAVLIEGEQRNQIMAVLAELGDRCKELLIQNMFYNSSMKEIAKVGKYSSEQLVRNTKYKCLKKLKEMVSARPQLEMILRSYE